MNMKRCGNGQKERRRPDVSERYDIRLSGSGGQGIILMGIILAEAIGIYDGKYVAQTQSYGPEARGGSSKAEVVVSDSDIDYPKALKLDLLVAMDQKACDDYYMDLKPDGTLIVDTTFVKQSTNYKGIPDTLYPYCPGEVQAGNDGKHYRPWGHHQTYFGGLPQGHRISCSVPCAQGYGKTEP